MEEEQHLCSDGGNPENGYKVGYALPPKKVESFILPSLLQHAQLRGIRFVSVDIVKPLTEQGPFHCILHKLYGNDWIFNLRDFKSKHPHVVIIDCPNAIQRLHNRISMLDIVNHLPPPEPENHTLTLTLGIPKQVVLYTHPDAEMESLSLNFPVIAKPLEADGTPNSHQMSLVLNSDGLNKVSPSAPVVLQEFVNHGGVLFKVYVAGNHVRCVKRPSLPDLHLSQLESESAQGGILHFSRISNLPATATVEDAQIEMPPLDFLHHIAQGLRQALKLHLFNFDMIRDSTLTGRYVIIDINYFPGYAKLPGFESMLTDFFMDLLTPLSLGSASAAMDGL